MIGSSPELGPITAGTHLLKWREVKYWFSALGHLSHFAGFVCSFLESIGEGIVGKGGYSC